jgi:CheY-like chemotaxis protein
VNKEHNNHSTVLVVDDDTDIREVMKILLEADGYHVDVAVDCQEAAERIRSGARPDLIILDLMTPRMDGEQFLRKVHRGSLATIPVIIMSGHGAAEEKARELGAAHCLTKPVEFHDLLKVVKQYTQ